MNKTDMMKAAQKAEELGLDPDTVMVTYTLEEFAESRGDDVDTFDEDSLAIQNLTVVCQEIQDAIDLVKEDIQVTEECLARSTYWAEKHEYQSDLLYLNKKLREYQSQLAPLVKQLTELKEAFHDKYAR